MSVILGGGMSSRLFTEVREKRGLAYYIGTSSDSYLDAGDFSTFAGVENTKIQAAVEVILSEYKKIRDERVSTKELQKAKDYVKGKMAISFESSDDLASFYAGQELLEGRIVSPEEKFEKLNRVTIEDVYETASDIFKPERLNLALIGPFAREDSSIYKIVKL